MNKIKTLICALLICVMAMPLTAFACTPPLNPPSFEMPDIDFKPNGELKDAIKNYTDNWFKKCILTTPTVETATSYTVKCGYFNYTSAIIKWDSVENATSYKIRITKTDNSVKEYEAKENFLYLNSYADDFIAGGLKGCTVKIKALGENDTFSYWSNETEVTAY
nr:MAG TPA: hypothetical protein [Caudoviricetes sp.]